MAIFLSLVLVKTTSTISAAASSSVRYLAVACLGSMAAILLHSAADFNLYVEPNAMLLSWVSAIGVSISLGEQPEFSCPFAEMTKKRARNR